MQKGIDKAAKAAGIVENPPRRIQELINENDTSAGQERLPVYNVKGQEAGAY